MTPEEATLEQTTQDSQTQDTTSESQPQTSTESSDRNLADRGIRHRDIIKPEELEKVTAVIVGAGAIGSHVAKQLAHVGVKRITLIDFDTVDVENLAVQGFEEADLGKPKVEAVAEKCKAIFGEIVMNPVNGKFDASHLRGLVADDENLSSKVLVCSCVDSMEVRRQIWEEYKSLYKDNDDALFIDSRMAAETARVLAIRGTDEEEYYGRSVFADSDGLPQSCTSKATIYCANIAAGMVTAAFTKWLRGMCPDRDVLFNIFASQVTYDSENLV